MTGMLRLICSAAAVLLLACGGTQGYRVIQKEYGHDGEEPHAFFEPYNPGFVGTHGDPTNHQRWRVNEGNPFSNMHPNIFEGVHPRQVCPGMTAPDADGHYYCTSEQAGYCDRRSGACFCFRGYQGLDCSACRPSHFRSGDFCLPKKLCPQDCSGAGTCDYATGTCTCEAHRLGDDCSKQLCEKFDKYCVECSSSACDRCLEGYTPDPVTQRCFPCTVYDPRCTVCDYKECLQCGDPLLTSIRRSGRRRHDSKLPFDELRRETSDENPHMTQARTAFDEAEKFYLVTDVVGLRDAGFVRSTLNTTEDTYVYTNVSTIPPVDGDPAALPLRNLSVQCDQGLGRDKTWTCNPFPVSHVVCGHPGLFSFSSPTYSIWEDDIEIRITVVRSGGGLGRASVRYNLIHNTTTTNDVTPTIHYTSTQTLVFEHGQVRKSFLLAINNNNLPEADENFRLELSEPTNGASLGNQWITQVTIRDDERRPHFIINHLNSSIPEDNNISTTVFVAGEEARFDIESRNFEGLLTPPEKDDYFVVEIHDRNTTGTITQRLTPVVVGEASDAPANDGRWEAVIVPQERGIFDLRVEHAARDGLHAEYWDNPYMLGDPVIQRIDHVVNFTWDSGRITEYGTDFVSVRWKGRVLSDANGIYTFYVNADDNVRLWVGGQLLIDKWWSPTEDSYGSIRLVAQRLTEIRLEYRDRDGPAHCYLSWTTPRGEPRHVIPYKFLYAPMPIPGSPFKFNVKAGIANANVTGGGSLARGSGLVHGIAGQTLSFTVASRDRYSNDRLGDGASDLFRVLAVRDDGSGTGFDGSSGGIGLEEVAGIVTFNTETYLHDVQWRPMVAGVYRLHVDLWTDWRTFDPIYGSPFRVEIEPARTSAPESDAFGVGLSNGIAGTLFNFTLIARDVLGNLRGRTGDDWKILAAHTVDSIGVEASCVDPYKNGTYSCSYRPLKSGTYSLLIMLDGLHVRNSPYTVVVNVAPTDGTRCIADGPGLLNATEGVETYFDVFIRDSFDNPRYLDGMDAFVVTLSGPEDVVMGTAVYEEDDRYRVFYTPTWDGVRELEVIVEGGEISGSPFHPVVVPGAAFGPTTTAYGIGLTNGTAGFLPEFLVQVRDTTGNEKFTGEDVVTTQSTATQITPGGPVVVTTNHTCTYTGSGGIFRCVYNATVAAVHQLDIQVNNQTIFDSPFHPLILPAPMDPYTSVASGSGLEYVVAGDLAPVYVRPVDRWGNDLLRAIRPETEILSVRLAGDGVGGLGVVPPEVEIPVDDFENGTLWVGYTPLTSGEFFLTMDMVVAEGLEGTYFSQRDFLSPVLTRLDPTIDFDWGHEKPEDTFAVGEEYSVRWEGFFRPAVTQIHTFVIEVSGSVRFRIGSTGRTSIAQSDSGSGTVRPQRVGTSFDLGETSLTLIEEFPSTEKVHSAELLLEADLFYPVVLEFSDTDGEMGSLSWSYSTPTSAMQIVPPSQLFRPLSHPVSLSPYNPLIVPAPVSPINCVAEGAGLSRAVSNITSSFVVHARDRFNNTRAFWRGGDIVNVTAVRVTGEDEFEEREHAMFSGEVVDLGNAFYQVTYVPQVSGIYDLNVFVGLSEFANPDLGPTVGNDTVDFAHIEGSPFTLVVKDDAGYGPTSTVFGHGRNNATAGYEDHFQVQARDVNGNNRTEQDAISISAVLRLGQGQSAREVIVHGVAIYDTFGLYDVYYTAPVSGFYDLNVAVNGRPTLDSPYELFVTPAEADAPATDTMDVINSTSTAGEDTYFTVIARDQFGNRRLYGGDEFVVRIVGQGDYFAGTTHVSGVVFDNDNGLHTVRYNVPTPGLYLIYVGLANDRNTPHGLLGEFWVNRWMSGPPTQIRADPRIDFKFTIPSLPSLTRYASVEHSARWTGFIQAPENGTYTFYVNSDDGTRLYVANELLIDELDSEPGDYNGTASVAFLQNALYEIKLEYRQINGPAEVELGWSWEDGVGANSTREIVPTERLFSGAPNIMHSPFTMHAV